MSLSYLTPGVDSVTHQKMNNLFGELDDKLSRVFGGGKSFILAADDYSWALNEPPLMRLLGVPFFFHQTGTAKYVEPLVNMVVRNYAYPFSPFPQPPYSDSFPPYDEQKFIDAKNNAILFTDGTPDFDPYDSERGIVKIKQTPTSYWNQIPTLEYPSANFFDYSLYAYKFDNPPLSSYSFNNLYLASYAIGNSGLVGSASVSSVFSGDSNTLYFPDFFIEGKSETKVYTGGVADGVFYSGGTPVASNANIWRMDVSAPSGHYFLNNGSAFTVPVELSKRKRIPVSGNATITLSYNLVDNLQINPPNPHWGRISLDRVNPNSDGYYLQEIGGDLPFGDREYFCQAERTNRYALADIFVEDRTGIYLPGSGNKFDCYRVHNFNESILPVTIGTGFSYSMTPFECRTFRKFADDNWQTGYHYFFPYESGDPRYYTVVPLVEPFTNTSISGVFSWQSVYNSHAANNLLNPSIIFDWIEAYSSECNPLGDIRTYADGSLRPKKALLYQDVDTTISDNSLYYSGFYNYPIDNNTILGDLIHHTGILKIAKISNTNFDASGNPSVEFDSVLFRGYSTIVSDFAAKNIDVTEGNNSYILENLDPDNSLVLITESTNLLKSGEYIPAAVNLPYELENYILDSSYYQDSWYHHISGQNVLFQSEIINDVSGRYITTGDFIDTIKYYKHTVGDLKTSFGLAYSGVTGNSSFSNFSFKLSPFGLYCDFDENIPALNSLLPYQDFHGQAIYTQTDRFGDTDENDNPINWFGEIKSARKSAVPWTRLQGVWDLDGVELTRKRRIHFRGHGFAWANNKYNSNTLIPEDDLAGLPSFNTLYTNAKYGRFHLSHNSATPINYLTYGGIDFNATGNFIIHRGELKVTENLNPYSRDINFFNYTGGAYEWERFLNFNTIDAKDACLDLNALQFSSYYHDATPLNDRYKFGTFDETPYVPILAEHWNGMAEKVNSIKYARPLSADQWYKVRLKQDVGLYQYPYGFAIPIFKWFHIGYGADSFPYDGDYYSRTTNPFKLPLDTYLVLNRQDMKSEWGLFDIDMPFDYYNWFTGNFNIRIQDSNSGWQEAVNSAGLLPSGTSGVSSLDLLYYDTFDDTQGKIYITPFNNISGTTLANANPAIYPNPNGGTLQGIHYLSVEDVNSFFTGFSQHFYYKSTFQPLEWEVIKNYDPNAYDPTGWLITGHYNHSHYGWNIEISNSTGPSGYLNGTNSLPLFKTALIPSNSAPTYKSIRNLQQVDDGNSNIDLLKYRLNRLKYTQTGDNSFIYNYTLGDSAIRPGSEIFSGDYLSVSHLTSSDSNDYWSYTRETLSTGNEFIEQLLPLGVALYSNNSNQLKWKMVGLKEYYKIQNEIYPFNTMDNYANFNLSFDTYASTGIFQIEFNSTNTWTGCINYITNSYGPHILAELHEPVIEL